MRILALALERGISMPRPDLLTAIEALENEQTAMQRQATEIRSMINLLCQRAGLEPRYPEVDETTHAPTPANIRPDAFYGKRMQTAAREFLEMRKRSDLGPAAPREIFDALKAGGYQFEAKDDSIALVGVRAMLRKNSGAFHKLPTGQYGLTVWYKDIKAPKDGGDDRATSSASKRATAKRKRKKRAKPKTAKRSTAGKKANPEIAPFVARTIRDGSDWTTEKLRQEAISKGIPGVDEKTKLNSFHVVLLGLRRRGLARMLGKGVWHAETSNPVDSNEPRDPNKVIPMKVSA